MAKAKKKAKASGSKTPKNIMVSTASAIKTFFAKITSPIRSSKAWKFLRKKILRSPFGGYFVNSWRELKQVTWPNRKTTWKFTFTVIVFSAFFAALVSVLDYGFDNLAQRIFLQ